jgi:hypothetical protein
MVVQKVDFTPTPGVLFSLPEGYVAHWIENNVLYTLIIEQDIPIDQLKDIINHLHLL